MEDQKSTGLKIRWQKLGKKSNITSHTNRETMDSSSPRKKQFKIWLCKEENPSQQKHKHREMKPRRKSNTLLQKTEEEGEEEEGREEARKEEEEAEEDLHMVMKESSRTSRQRKTSDKRN